jgi:hypothetical protein
MTHPYQVSRGGRSRPWITRTGPRGGRYVCRPAPRCAPAAVPKLKRVERPLDYVFGVDSRVGVEVRDCARLAERVDTERHDWRAVSRPDE